MPVRIANIWRELHLLPEELKQTPGVKLIDQLYSQSFSEILTYVEKDSKVRKGTLRLNTKFSNVLWEYLNGLSLSSIKIKIQLQFWSSTYQCLLVQT